MKTLEEVDKAREKLRERITSSPWISKDQLALLVGMLNVLVWVADAPDCSTFERLLAGESIAKKE